MDKLSLSFISSMTPVDKPDVLAHVWMYVDRPKGWVCVDCSPFKSAIAWNPETKEVKYYRYHETKCYMDSASDTTYNGHYSEILNYVAE